MLAAQFSHGFGPSGLLTRHCLSGGFRRALRTGLPLESTLKDHGHLAKVEGQDNQRMLGITSGGSQPMGNPSAGL
jgi:hypothetical protein